MKCQLSRQEIIELLADFIRGEVREEDDKYIVTVTIRETPIALQATFSEIESLSSKLLELEINDETVLFNDFEYEVPVKEEFPSPMLRSRLRESKIEVSNEDNGFKYEFSSASNHYLVWFLNAIKKNLLREDFKFFYIKSGRYLEEESKTKNLIDFVHSNSSRLLTLKILSTKNKRQTASQYSKLTYAFLFHIGYNLDVALVPQPSLEEMTRRSRITRMRRSKTDIIEPPRRLYNEDLVQHYLLAVSTENPLVEYLSYYHIIEHFYEAVFNDDLLEIVKNDITDPAFSYKNMQHISKLVNKIKNSFPIRNNETMTFKESDALKLCLLKYTSLPELRLKLAEYDETLLNYYKTTKVKFSGGVEVDLDSKDTEKSILKKLAERIYATRNALVHSKNGDKSKYTPFKDDRVLVKEVPLMRFIAEMVVLAESTVE